MKKFFCVIFLLILPVFVSGCRANVVGKYNDYNEIFAGTIDLDLLGNGFIDVVTYPSNVSCKGKGTLTYMSPQGSLGMCKGQAGDAEIKCSDGRVITGEWECQKWVRITGTATTNTDEDITFYIEKSNKKSELMKEKYLADVKQKPLLPKHIFGNERLIKSYYNAFENLF